MTSEQNVSDRRIVATRPAATLAGVLLVIAATHTLQAMRIAPMIEQRVADGCLDFCGLDAVLHGASAVIIASAAVTWFVLRHRSPRRSMRWVGVGGLAFILVLSSTLVVPIAWQMNGLAAVATFGFSFLSDPRPAG